MRTREEIEEGLENDLEESKTIEGFIAKTVYLNTEILLDIRDLLLKETK